MTSPVINPINDIRQRDAEQQVRARQQRAAGIPKFAHVLPRKCSQQRDQGGVVSAAAAG